MTIETDILNRWLVSPASQQGEEIASLSHETHRIPDPYIFLVRGHLLISPSNGIPVDQSILRRGEIEEKEFEAFRKIERWAAENERGTALWFSPPAEGDYPNLKIVVSKIMRFEKRGKILFNRAIILDVDASTALKIANYFSGGLIWNTEELRGNPKFLTPSEEYIWPETLSRYTSQTAYLLNSEDLIIKEATLQKARGVTSLRQAQKRGLIGQYPDSCGAFGFFFAHAEQTFPCPKCGRDIPSGQGITTCPHCGAKKEDYRKCD